ncbi:MAG: CDP-glycerol glycerophosphotransferase family protein [Methanobrevibacter sp.]|nr:CDP-glycerol glycerophosphotransferase family protein [Methanobrevibacter sp.]
MTHDTSGEGNVLYSFNYFKSKDPDLFCKKITQNTYDFNIDRKLIKKLVNFFIFTPFHVASSKIILLDNIFLPFAYTKFKKSVAVVQLWHGTGTMKKFVLDSEKGILKKLANKSSSKQTHLIVGSNKMIPTYKSAFGLESKNIFPIGSPRTDFFFNEDYIQTKKSEFYTLFPELSNKKVILYAPTFRDESFKKKFKNKKLNLDDSLNLNLEIFNLLKYLNDEYVLVLRLHPSISKNFSMDNLKLDYSFKKRIYDFSTFNSLNSLLLISDCLITDYSSIIFEYSLMNKKMIFYPYDLKDFEKHSRGLYFNYEQFVPGDIVMETTDISKKIVEKSNGSKIEMFKDKYMKECNGNSAKNLYKILNEFMN